MAHYDFDTVIDRSNTNALNTDGFRRYIFHADIDKTFDVPDEDFIRMWVADMEFAVAPEIRQAMKDAGGTGHCTGSGDGTASADP